MHRVDHIVFRLATTEPLFALLTDGLGLPVSWPLQHSDFATFGWVTVGNCNLELWAAADNSDLPTDAMLPLIHGIALGTDNLSEDLLRLARFDVAYKAPRAYQTVNTQGRKVTNFTNAVVLDVSSPTCCVFFCEWNAAGTIFPCKYPLTTEARRQRDQAALERCNGGPLGVTGLREIHLRAPPAAQSVWKTLANDGTAQLGPSEGVKIQTSAAQEQTINALTFGVRSLDAARAFLAAHSMLGDCQKDEIALCRSVTQGLDLRFRQTCV